MLAEGKLYFPVCQIIEGKIRFVKPVDLVLDTITMKPELVTFQELKELSPPPALSPEEIETKNKLERLFTTHYYKPKNYHGPKQLPKPWLREQGGVQ